MLAVEFEYAVETVRNAIDCATDRVTSLHLGMAIVALEKQIPKKIIFNAEDDRKYEDYICPNCKDILQQIRKGATVISICKYRFCPGCGQALEWKYKR